MPLDLSEKTASMIQDYTKEIQLRLKKEGLADVASFVTPNSVIEELIVLSGQYLDNKELWENLVANMKEHRSRTIREEKKRLV